MKGLIFDIKRFAIHDGPGIRTTVFFKGCPLVCDWCHNPESRSCHIESYMHVEKVGEMEFESKKEAGRYYSLEELYKEVNKDRVFYDESGGGITCSGGEPLYQPKFLAAFLRYCKENQLQTCVDTTGYASWNIIKSILPYTDLFLFDVKHLDPVKHREGTGVDNRVILQNLEKLLEEGARIQLRFPLIPGFNDGIEHIHMLLDYVTQKLSGNILGISILPYHNLGISKFEKFQVSRNNDYKKPDPVVIEQIKTVFKENNIEVNIGG